MARLLKPRQQRILKKATGAAVSRRKLRQFPAPEELSYITKIKPRQRRKVKTPFQLIGGAVGRGARKVGRGFIPRGVKRAAKKIKKITRRRKYQFYYQRIQLKNMEKKTEESTPHNPVEGETPEVKSPDWNRAGGPGEGADIQRRSTSQSNLT